MGNSNDKGGRGQALGTSSSQSYQHRPQRKQLVQSKKTTSSLQHKERILDVLDKADQRAAYESNPNLKQYQSQSNSQLQSQSQSQSQIQQKQQTHKEKEASKQASKMQSSVYMSDPSSREAIAAQNRIKLRKPKDKSKNERRGRTRDLLFGDGLNRDSNENSNPSSRNSSKSPNPPKKKPISQQDNFYGNEDDVFIASGKAAQAAVDRFTTKKKQSKKMGDRKQRTMDLLHGDALKGDNYYENQNISQNSSQSNLQENITNDSINDYHGSHELDDGPNEETIRSALTNIKDDPKNSKKLMKIIKDVLNGKTNKVNPAKIDPKINNVLIALCLRKETMPNKDGEMTEYLVSNELAINTLRYAEQEIFQLLNLQS